MVDDNDEVLRRPFGAASRNRLLGDYFASAGEVTPANAWRHVYRLLLWTDRTTGLVHCYESDKCQPGRPWYERSLRFHDWLAAEFGVAPGRLGQELDWLFRRGTEQLASALASQQAARADRAAEQFAPYAGSGMPLPGEDPALAALIEDELSAWFATTPPSGTLRDLSRKIQTYMAQENKRRNLLGEGFEDVLASVIGRLHRTDDLRVQPRPFLHDVSGFRRPPGNEKPRKVDLAITKARERALISAKWSVRADREEQFAVDFDAYARLEEHGEDFGFVLVTNEFDAARLRAACHRRRLGGNLFTQVVHVNPDGPRTAYGGSGRGAASELDSLIADGRLISLEQWLTTFTR